MALEPRVIVSWKIDFQEEIIHIQVIALTSGFIGIGLSAKGGMLGSDAYIGKYKDGMFKWVFVYVSEFAECCFYCYCVLFFYIKKWYCGIALKWGIFVHLKKVIYRSGCC